MQAQQAIRRVNRDLSLTWVIHALLVVGLAGGMVVGSLTGIPSVLIAAIPCTIWVLLAFNGMRETRNAMQWPMLIASGQLEEAERQIEQAISGFSVLRSVKLLSLHQLAVLRMAQRNWADAAQLSRALAGHRHGKDPSLQRASMLVLGGAAVRLGDLQEAYRVVVTLRGMALALDEQLTLLLVESAYLAKIGAWNELVHGIDAKARLAELMPTEVAAQTQGYLALGARHAGRVDWESYLVHRCGLLMEPARLCVEEPMFRELWP